MNIEQAIAEELAKPDARSAIEGVEKVVLEVIKNVLESQIPGFLRPFIGGFVDSMAERGIKSLVDLTDHALRGLAPVEVKTGQLKMALVVVHSPDLPTGPEETVADWPSERNK